MAHPLTSVASTGNIARTSLSLRSLLRVERQRESSSGWSRTFGWAYSRCQWLAWKALEGQVTLLACLFLATQNARVAACVEQANRGGNGSIHE